MAVKVTDEDSGKHHALIPPHPIPLPPASSTASSLLVLSVVLWTVLILLSTKSPTSITHPERRIILTQSRPTLKIGRSSNRSVMGLTPTLDNGYFDSPVMSREHAEIEADIPRQVSQIL